MLNNIKNKWQRIIVIIVVLILISGFASQFLEDEILKKIFVSISIWGGLLVLLSFFGFENIRKYFFQLFYNQYIDDQYDILLYLAGLYKDKELVEFYHKKDSYGNHFFKEALYMGAIINCDYNKEKALNYFNILKSIVNRKTISGISNEVIILVLIKLGIQINEKDKNSIDLEELKAYKSLLKRNSVYLKLMNDNDKQLKAFLK